MIESALTLELPEYPSKRGWVLDSRAIEEAIRELGIRFFVKIRYSGGRQTLGTHRAISTPYNHHRITISQVRNNDLEVSNTIWHELAHAKQSEEWYRSIVNAYPVISGIRDSTIPNPAKDLFSKFYRLEYKGARGRWGASYMENTYEINAREIADISRGKPLCYYPELDRASNPLDFSPEGVGFLPSA